MVREMVIFLHHFEKKVGSVRKNRTLMMCEEKITRFLALASE